MTNPKKQEQEQAYIVFSDTPKDVAEYFVQLENIAGFMLSEPEVHTIVDTYYDTPDNDLRMSTVTLRTRVLDGELYITFKGKEQSDDFTQDHSEWDFLSPFDADQLQLFTSAAGLVPVQTRETTRITRYLDNLSVDENGQPVSSERIAEINFDNSFYTVSTGQARIFELEVERQSGPKMKKLRKLIEEKFEEDSMPLVRWPHGKFITGKSIEFAFGVKTDENLNLNLESFGYIQNMFKQLKVKS